MKRETLCALLASASGLVLTGCVQQPACGDLTTATNKLSSGDIGSIDACEWVLLSENASTLGPEFGITPPGGQWPVLTQQQAQAIVDFLAANNIQTITQLEKELNSGTLQIPPELMQIFFPTAT